MVFSPTGSEIGFLTLVVLLTLSGCPPEWEDPGPVGDWSGTPDDIAGDDDDTTGDDDAGDDDAGPGPVDEFWGEAPDLDTRLVVFDKIWLQLADEYAAFAVQDMDWDAVYDDYRPRVENAESYGRFVAVLTDLMGTRMRDGHTWLFSERVCFDSDLSQRPPVFRIDMHSSTLGACTTPMVDGTLLVYRAADDNPAGLEPGDRIVGYDDVPWPILVSGVTALGLPTCGHHAPAASAETYNLMVSAVSNAHLFDHLDVIRHGETDVESIPTEDLLDYVGDPDQGFFGPAAGLVCSEQLPVAGVEFPWTDFADAGDPGEGSGQTSWGVVEGTNIGYIYLYSWGLQVFEDFHTAVTELWNTDGLIIDQRYNVGGYAAWEDGLAELFDTDHPDVMYQAFRAEGGGYTDLDLEHPQPGYGWRSIDADEATYYDHPIAVLQGPHAASAGDIFPYFMTLHPRARRFGQPTHGSFGGKDDYWFIAPDPYVGDFYMAYTNHTDLDRDLLYLQGTEQWPEQAARLDPDDVAAGVDTVVAAALAWIEAENAPRQPTPRT